MSIPLLPNASAQMERLGSYVASSHVVGAIRTAASAVGVSFNVLATKAAMESGLRADAQAGASSARGLFQFTDQTWLSMVQKHGADHALGTEAAAIVTGPGGRLSVQDPAERSRILALRQDPELSARFAGEYLRDVSDTLGSTLGHRPDAAELYLGHFLGPTGATRMLQALNSDPTRTASSVLPAAAAANPGMFNGPDGEPLTVAQFNSRVRSRLNGVYAQMGLTAPAGPINFQPVGEPATTRSMAGEPGGWGNGTPARVAHGSEQAMVSTLTKVFSRMGRGAGRVARGGNTQGIPSAVLSAMRQTNGAQGSTGT